MSSTKRNQRRRFLSRAAAIPVVLVGSKAFADGHEEAEADAAAEDAGGGLKKLTEEDPRYAALGYHPDASAIDPASEPQFKEGNNCANCAQLKGEPGNEYRPCALFIDLENPSQMLLVAEEGWCRSWMAQPA